MDAQLPDGNPKLPDSINNTNESPLRDFLLLASALLLLVVMLSAALAFGARWLAPLVPYSWERDWLSHSSLPDSPQEQALNDLMQRLLSRQSEPLPVTLHWLGDEDTPNAFAMIGGHIFVTRGLLENVSSENALAMVLAHEYAHVEQRHPLTLMLEQLSIGTLTSLFGGDAAALISQNSNLLTMLSFSRDMEREADQRALGMLQTYYGHTAGAGEFFEQMMAQHSESRWAQVFATHPLTTDRLQAIEQTSGTGTPLPLPAVLAHPDQP